MDDRYFWKKNLITSSTLIFLAIIQLILNIMTRYYWNPVQAKISGMSDFVDAGGDANSFGYLLGFLLLFCPVIVLVFLTRGAGEKKQLRFVLIPTFGVYVVSAIMLVQKLRPFKAILQDPYDALDKFVFIPMFLQAFLMGVYLLCIIIKSDLLLAKIIAVITIVISILYFIADAAYLAYLHMMDTFSGDFGLITAALILACYVLDVATFFLMLSALMSYCAMQREPIIEMRLELKMEKREERLREKQNIEENPEAPDKSKKKRFFLKGKKADDDEVIADEEALEAEVVAEKTPEAKPDTAEKPLDAKAVADATPSKVQPTAKKDDKEAAADAAPTKVQSDDADAEAEDADAPRQGTARRSRRSRINAKKT
ncbi:MAG: hypothetical protein LBU41_03410 [Clostridiales Family XIII bacterium]|jgi:hypothetical protein|nr:hypothetical protein [Clostridiales Family XIII bacterium]